MKFNSIYFHKGDSMSIRVNANSDAEQTGQNGSLPDSNYDIFCKDFGGPEYRMNYLSSSCKERQAQNTCKRVNCHRFTAPIPTKEQLRAAVKSNEGRIKKGSSYGILGRPFLGRKLSIWNLEGIR